MKRVYVNEEWCLGCHLCEYNCAFANSGETDMVKALKGKPIYPRIRVEDSGKDDIHFAVSCRHCTDPICVKSCISGALSIQDGVISVDQSKCVGCLTCVLVCPMAHWLPTRAALCRSASFACKIPAASRPVSRDVPTGLLYMKRDEEVMRR